MAGVVLPGTIKGYKEAAKTAALGAENAIRRALSDVSKAENPITVKEFAQLPDAGSIDPKRIRTMQDNIRPSFRDDRSLEETIESLRSGKIKPEDIPPIRIGEINGEIYTLDHRRLVAFREAGLPITYQKASPGELRREGRNKNTSTDGGSSPYILSALGLLGMTATTQIFVYPGNWMEHLMWASILVALITKGPGRLSLDHVIGQLLRGR